MIMLLTGIAIFCAVLGLFSLKDRLKSRRLARFAHSGLVMRFTVISVVMMVVGILLELGRLFS